MINMYICNILYYNLNIGMYLSNTRHNKIFLIKLIIFLNNNKVDL